MVVVVMMMKLLVAQVLLIQFSFLCNRQASDKIEQKNYERPISCQLEFIRNYRMGHCEAYIENKYS